MERLFEKSTVFEIMAQGKRRIFEGGCLNGLGCLLEDIWYPLTYAVLVTHIGWW